MWRNSHSRRVLIAGDPHSLAFAREQYAALAAEHDALAAELVDLQRQVAELRDVLQLVVSVSRQQAETDVATLRRQLEVAIARLERSPTQRLN
jgi:hypothetical protein